MNDPRGHAPPPTHGAVPLDKIDREAVRKQSEVQLGLRCPCGEPITEGWEYVILGEIVLGPQGPIQQAFVARTCADCETSRAYGAQAIARRPLSWERLETAAPQGAVVLPG